MEVNNTFKLWPEESLPQEAADYLQCEVCTKNSRIIWGEGNPTAPIIVILDNPGAREDKEGMEYVCPTRQVLQRTVYNVGLRPENLYVTYLLKCRPLRKYDKEQVRAFSKPFLLQQLQSKAPKYIVCLGDVVVQTMFDDSEAHVRTMRGVWHELLGVPCMISYHPLAVSRRPNLLKNFEDDWRMLSESCRRDLIQYEDSP